jgi:type II secretory pathway pseudopilin PulG
MKLPSQNQQGFLLPALLIFIVAFAVLGAAVGAMIFTTLQGAVRNQESETAFNAAEAGLNYYLWHMNHNSGDLKDGQTTPTDPDTRLGYGPYVHDYTDISNTKVGTFTLWIKPGGIGSTTATVRSIGRVSNDPNVVRTVEAQIGAPSFSTYAVAGNTALWFGNTETANGPVHSNVGVKMDGANTDLVTSAQGSYTVPDWSGSGAGTTKPGVWCDPAVTTPVNCNTRSKTSWAYPVPAIDFNKVTADLCALKKQAASQGGNSACIRTYSRSAGYVPPVNGGTSSSTIGYLITLNDDGTYSLSKVTNERDTLSPYSSALSLSTIQNNIAIPDNGIIYVEDNVWVRTAGPNGFDGRVTIAAARLGAAGTSSITIADNLKYKDKYNGNDTIGLIAQKDVLVAPYAPAPLEVDGALIAQSGSVGIRQTYNTTGDWVKGHIQPTQGIQFYGSLASNQIWTWSVQLCGDPNNVNCWAGYEYTTNTYDPNLRYAPPPSYPVTSSFDMLSWREVLTTP